MTDAWVGSGHDDSVSDGQGAVAPITPRGRPKRLRGDPMEYPRGVWVSDEFSGVSHGTP